MVYFCFIAEIILDNSIYKANLQIDIMFEVEDPGRI